MIALFADLMHRSGYGLIQSPMFEDVGVFQRIGEGTDVVSKEMYEFDDRGGRRLALRPEGTASVARAFVQHRPPVPWKVWYVTPSFRYERPQAGRYRQHHQLGAEVLGTADPDVDVEVIALAWACLRALGLRRVLLLVNTMGDLETRHEFLAELQVYLQKNRSELDPADQDKVDRHPMRLLDSKREATRAVTADAPRISEFLSGPARSHFQRVQDGLGALDIPFALEPRLVRGFDYYTHTTFELQSSALETAQAGIAGGGRYDGLVAELGGTPTPGIGFGMGIERVLLACDAENAFDTGVYGPEVWVVDVAGGESARDLSHQLRAAGMATDRSFDNRSMRSQMKSANRSGAKVAVIVGEQELAEGTVAINDLRSSRDQVLVPRDEMVATVRDLLATESPPPDQPGPYHWLGGQE